MEEYERLLQERKEKQELFDRMLEEHKDIDFKLLDFLPKV